MGESRDERRRKAREEERRRGEELDEKARQKPAPPFEAPASGKIVDPRP